MIASSACKTPRCWPWQAEPHKLWSLPELITFVFKAFLISYAGLMDARWNTRRTVDAGRGPDQVDPDDRKLLGMFAQFAERDCSALGLTAPALLARELRWRLLENHKCTYERAAAEADAITHLMAMAFHEQHFAYVPSDRAQYFEEDNLFKLPRKHPFPSVRDDIKAAGNCLALDLNTAAVYHLMRVAEIGLRALAKHLKVSIKNKKTGKSMPLEWEEWQAVLTAIETAIETKYPQSGAAKKTKATNREFYRGLLQELQGFKDVYRNHVMHVRKDYTYPVAAEALVHVGAFMRRLSTRVRE
jgi:hypothetical protein